MLPLTLTLSSQRRHGWGRFRRWLERGEDNDGGSEDADDRSAFEEYEEGYPLLEKIEVAEVFGAHWRGNGKNDT
jgi:hypothetical protein